MTDPFTVDRKYDSSSTSDSEASISPRPRNRKKTYQDGIVEGAAGGAAYAVADRDRKYGRSSDDGRSRNGASTAVATRTNNGTVSTRDTKSTNNDHDSDSDSSSSVCSSSEDERRRRKARRSEFITAGLAAVATIHATGGVINSLKARDQRWEEVRSGEMTVEEAKKQQNKARLQDLAAVGIAALGIKGAYSKWQGTKAQHDNYKNTKKEKSERHQKRERKREKMELKARGADPKLAYQDRPRGDRPKYSRTYSESVPDLGRGAQKDYDEYPRYNDGNPYGGYRNGR